jgi:hypothetical protein
MYTFVCNIRTYIHTYILFMCVCMCVCVCVCVVLYELFIHQPVIEIQSPCGPSKNSRLVFLCSVSIGTTQPPSPPRFGVEGEVPRPSLRLSEVQVSTEIHSPSGPMMKV